MSDRKPPLTHSNFARKLAASELPNRDKKETLSDYHDQTSRIARERESRRGERVADARQDQQRGLSRRISNYKSG